jgi:hypothetical protein
MPQRNLADVSEEELRRNFYYMGSEFFSWNAGKNTPNILLQLSGRLEGLQVRTKEAADAIETLHKTAKTASEASGELSKALNRIYLGTRDCRSYRVIAPSSVCWFLPLDVCALAGR